MRAALINDSANVINVIEYDPTAEYDPGQGIQLMELADELVGPGWRLRNGAFLAPAVQSLSSDRAEIPADNTTSAQITYVNTRDDAPANAVFDINGASATCALVNGKAQVCVTASQPDQIVVTCDGFSVTITATAVS